MNIEGYFFRLLYSIQYHQIIENN